MKIRTGFVSNSSSSSFIICYALISDAAKAQVVIGGNRNVDVFTEKELINEIKSARWGSPLECDWANIDVSMITTSNPDQLHAIYKSSDGVDLICDDDGDYNYNVSFNQFKEASFINETFTEENGFSNITIAFGAGRDG